MPKGTKKTTKPKTPKPETPPEAFPKISAQAKLKKVVMCDTANIAFESLSFSPDQYAQLERWRAGGDSILVTIEQIQATIPEPEPAAEEPDMFEDDNPDTEAGDK